MGNGKLQWETSSFLSDATQAFLLISIIYIVIFVDLIAPRAALKNCSRSRPGIKATTLLLEGEMSCGIQMGNWVASFGKLVSRKMPLAAPMNSFPKKRSIFVLVIWFVRDYLISVETNMRYCAKMNGRGSGAMFLEMKPFYFSRLTAVVGEPRYDIVARFWCDN